MGTFAKHYLHPTAMSPTLADRRQLNTTTPSGGADTGTSVQYPAASNGFRQFRPGTANNTAVASIPAANAVPTNKWGWRQPSDITAEKVTTIAGNWPVSARFTVSGATTGPSGSITFIAYLVSAGVDTTYTEIGRIEVSIGVAWAGGVIAGDLVASAVTGPLNSRVEVHVYMTVNTGHVGVGAMTVAINTNSADSFLGPGSYTVSAGRSVSATAIGVAPTPPRYARLASKSSTAVGVATRGLYAKPTARSATAIGITPTPLKYARLASKSATAVGVSTRQASLIRLASKAVSAIGLPTAARTITAFRTQAATAIGIPSYSRAVVAVRTFAATAIGIATRQPLFIRLAAKSATAVGVASQTRLVRLARSAVAVGIATQSRLIRFTRSATAIGNASMVRAVITIRSFIAQAIGVASGRIEMGLDVYNRATGGETPPANPTKAIAGVVRDSEGVPVPGATVKLFRQSDDRLISTATSDGAGAYSFPRDATDTAAYYVLAYEMAGVETHGVTDRSLIPA